MNNLIPEERVPQIQSTHTEDLNKSYSILTPGVPGHYAIDERFGIIEYCEPTPPQFIITGRTDPYYLGGCI